MTTTWRCVPKYTRKIYSNLFELQNKTTNHQYEFRMEATTNHLNIISLIISFGCDVFWDFIRYYQYNWLQIVFNISNNNNNNNNNPTIFILSSFSTSGSFWNIIFFFRASNYNLYNTIHSFVQTEANWLTIHIQSYYISKIP